MHQGATDDGGRRDLLQEGGVVVLIGLVGPRQARLRKPIVEAHHRELKEADDGRGQHVGRVSTLIHEVEHQTLVGQRLELGSERLGLEAQSCGQRGIVGGEEDLDDVLPRRAPA